MSLENSDTNHDVKISKSLERHTFQKEGYLKRCKEKGEEPSQEYLEMWSRIQEEESQKFSDPGSRKNNMEYDLLTTDWILDKVRSSDSYAQNLYAAMCNMRFVRKEMFPFLRQDPDKDLWSVSWRCAGGIIADMREEGDYIDWYCSGIAGGDEPSVYLEGADLKRKNYVPEGIVTEEIEADLLRLGWIPVPWED